MYSGSCIWIGYEELQTEILYILPLFFGYARIYVVSPEVAKDVFLNLKSFKKPDLLLGLKYVSGGI